MSGGCLRGHSSGLSVGRPRVLHGPEKFFRRDVRRCSRTGIPGRRTADRASRAFDDGREHADQMARPGLRQNGSDVVAAVGDVAPAEHHLSTMGSTPWTSTKSSPVLCATKIGIAGARLLSCCSTTSDAHARRRDETVDDPADPAGEQRSVAGHGEEGRYLQSVRRCDGRRRALSGQSTQRVEVPDGRRRLVPGRTRLFPHGTVERRAFTTCQ